MGKPMRPDVAAAFDQMAAAARREAGLSLSINSAFRSDAEQAALWNAKPNAYLFSRSDRAFVPLIGLPQLNPPPVYTVHADTGCRHGGTHRRPALARPDGATRI
jgi:hypothetical protein